MRINFLTIISVVIIGISSVIGYLYYKKTRGHIQSFDSSLAIKDSKKIDMDAVEDFREFLYENKGKFVHLSVILSTNMKSNVLRGMDKDGRIIFEAPDNRDQNKKIKYLIRLPDDGRRDFSFDQKSGKLEGYFKTFRRRDKNGIPIINLVPINPKYIKGDTLS